MVLLTSIWQNMPYLNDIGILKFIFALHIKWKSERPKRGGRSRAGTRRKHYKQEQSLHRLSDKPLKGDKAATLTS